MSNLQQDAQESRKLIGAFAKIIVKHPKAMQGSGRKVRGASKNAQPLNARNLKAGYSRTGRDDIRVRRTEKISAFARNTRDKNLAVKLSSLRSTREWLQFTYPNKNHPVRKLFEKELRK